MPQTMDLPLAATAEMSAAMLQEEQELDRKLRESNDQETANRIKHLASQRQDLSKDGDEKYKALMKLVSASKVR
jgi:hypothetical protein